MIIDTPQISVITVTKNNLNGLCKTKESLDQQTNQSFEWIVIDGASDDQSVSWLSKTNARWVSEPDDGLYDAMNKGIDRACGDYLYFLNAGDSLAAPDIFQRIKDSIKTTAPDFIYGDRYVEYKKKWHYRRARSPFPLYLGMFTHHQAMFYKRTALNTLRYDTRYEIAADYDFTVRFLGTARSLLYLPFAICCFEAGGLSQRRAKQGRMEQYKSKISNRLCGKSLAMMIYGLQTVKLALSPIGKL